ncbi:hypothetical protein B0H17DRAFT_1047227 [Mycena rosella]|uniref:Hyaluronan/mRNA-binding protein domain-containing protein n=1 Tax=Mycena rosella TaxID=1033263 RepID=A0AAD7GLC9_MYCRO|nr:hypothetical protein B0H17DRAFT_1047227 [Mycena rosella]
MTRTSRSASLRSVLKDRSESKTGLNNALRKNGGGAHNWGSLENERDLEFAGIDDGQQELDELDGDSEADTHSAHSDEATLAPKKPASPVLERSEEDLAIARKLRTNAFKGDGVFLPLSLSSYMSDAAQAWTSLPSRAPPRPSPPRPPAPPAPSNNPL